MNKKLFFSLISVFMLLFILTGCQQKSPSAEDSLEDEDVNKDYFGTYVMVERGELEGDYFDDYESVPLEADYRGNTVTLKSNGIYEADHFLYSEKYNDIYRIATNKYEYKFKDNEVIRERDTTVDNFKSFDKIFKFESGELRVTEDYIDRIEAENATIIKEEEDYVIYDTSEYKISKNEHDREPNHKEYDFITLEGDMISVNYYHDDDKTVVSIYKKQDS